MGPRSKGENAEPTFPTHPIGPKDSMDLVNCTIQFHGRVQGVGFRWTTRELFSPYPITGYVENRGDGSVILVAQGEREVVSSAIHLLRQHFASHIREATTTWESPTEIFQDFSIRRGSP